MIYCINTEAIFGALTSAEINTALDRWILSLDREVKEHNDQVQYSRDFDESNCQWGE